MTFFHGRTTPGFTAHEGLCLTTSLEAALCYGQYITTIEMSLGGLTEFEAPSTDPQTGIFPGDSAAEREALRTEGWDVMSYIDLDTGNAHPTLRLLSDRAIARIQIESVDVDSDADDE